MSSQNRWNAAEAEKQRLYAEARRNAAMTQLSGGADLEPMGLSQDVPHEPPPEYSPRQSGHPQVVVDPPAESSSDHDTTYPREKVPIAREGSGDSHESDTRTEQPLATPLAEMPGDLTRAASLSPTRESAEPPSSPFVGLGINGEGTSSSMPGVNDATSPTTSRHLPRPLSDKEQMKRYYEAQDKIARAQAVPPPFNNNRDANHTSFGAESSSSSMKPLSDKEAMRRFYEAQDQMNQAQAGSSSRTADRGEGSSSSGRGASSMGSSRPAPLDLSPRFMTAAEEKEMMKRRYEQATRQVSDHHQARRSDSGWSDSGHGHGGSSSATPTRPEFGVSEAPRSGSSQGHSRWASATEEKDAMRRRYEEAVNAMSQTGMGEGSSSGASRSGEINPAHVHPSYSGTSSSQTTPPPDLPQRPNAEYKTLLSPDLPQGMPGMAPYYGGPMMNPPFGMPMIPPFGPPMSPSMGMGPMFGMPMGMGMMPPNNPYAYGMPPGQMPQGYPAQTPYQGQYQPQHVDDRQEESERQYRQDS
jgi:hypothetical protein